MAKTKKKQVDGSGANDMNKTEWKRWIRNAFIFSIPTWLALLNSLQSVFTGESLIPNDKQLTFIIGSAYQAFLASMIDLLIKFRSDNSTNISESK